MLVRLGGLRHQPREPAVPIRWPEQYDDCVPTLTTPAPLADGTTSFAIECDDASSTREVHRVVCVRPLAHPASPTSAAAADATAIAATVIAAAAATAATATAAATAAAAPGPGQGWTQGWTWGWTWARTRMKAQLIW